jgi:hypothetical protein
MSLNQTGSDEKFMGTFQLENVKIKDHLGHLDIDGRIILKLGREYVNMVMSSVP